MFITIIIILSWQILGAQVVLSEALSNVDTPDYINTCSNKEITQLCFISLLGVVLVKLANILVKTLTEEDE
jgi:hypothetical protein